MSIFEEYGAFKASFVTQKAFGLLALSYEPRHAKMSLRAYANSEGPDQPAHPRSLIRAFATRKQNHWIL